MQQDRLNLKQWRNREDGLGQDRKRKNMLPKLPMITVGVTTLAAAEFEHHRKELPVEATGDRDTAAPAPGACVRFGCIRFRLGSSWQMSVVYPTSLRSLETAEASTSEADRHECWVNSSLEPGGGTWAEVRVLMASGDACLSY